MASAILSVRAFGTLSCRVVTGLRDRPKQVGWTGRGNSGLGETVDLVDEEWDIAAAVVVLAQLTGNQVLDRIPNGIADLVAAEHDEPQRFSKLPNRTKTFTLDDPALPMDYPGFVFRTLCKDGYDSKSLLAGTGLTAEHLKDPKFRTSFAPIRQFLLNAIAATGDQHLGIRLAWRFEPNYIGLPAYAAMNAAHFEDALVLLTRFFFLSFPAIDFSFPDAVSEKDEVGVRLRPKFPLEEITYFGTSSALIGCNGLFNAMFREKQVVSRGEMTIREPEGWAEIAEDIGFPIRFEASENRLIFPSELLTHPLPGGDPINHQRLLQLCEKFAADAEYETTLASRVLSFLETDGNLGTSLSLAASKLGYSERSMRRQLERTGTSYRILTDQVRERRAKELLTGTARSIQDIAYYLGYEAPSNFARSFKRWTGTSPMEFRDARRVRTELGQN